MRATSIQETREAFMALPVLGKAALGVALLAILLILPSLWDLGEAILGPRPAIPAVAEAETRTGERAAAYSGYLAQISGRSVFYNPEASPPPPPAVTDEEPTVPQRPTTYGGPAMAAMVFDEVWFADGKRFRVGAEEKDDLRVVATQAPWSATIEWKGVEFKVDLFTRNGIVFKETGDGAVQGASGVSPPEEPVEPGASLPKVKPAPVPQEPVSDTPPMPAPPPEPAPTPEPELPPDPTVPPESPEPEPQPSTPDRNR